ncbi:MAG: hypothetical protein H8E98_05265 [Bacteroidetes bacterium]|nr:hypothetical protein [Bacteroidota bacterium]
MFIAVCGIIKKLKILFGGNYMKNLIKELGSQEIKIISGGINIDDDVIKPIAGAILMISWYSTVGFVAWQLGKASIKPKND